MARSYRGCEIHRNRDSSQAASTRVSEVILVAERFSDGLDRYGPGGKIRFRFTVTEWAKSKKVQDAWKELAQKHGLNSNWLDDVDGQFNFLDGALFSPNPAVLRYEMYNPIELQLISFIAPTRPGRKAGMDMSTRTSVCWRHLKSWRKSRWFHLFQKPKCLSARRLRVFG